jgi:adenylate cyclase
MQAGETERAQQIVREALTDAPELSAEFIRTQELYADREILEDLVSRCTAAGLPFVPRARLAAV